MRFGVARGLRRCRCCRLPKEVGAVELLCFSLFFQVLLSEGIGRCHGRPARFLLFCSLLFLFVGLSARTRSWPCWDSHVLVSSGDAPPAQAQLSLRSLMLLPTILFLPILSLVSIVLGSFTCSIDSRYTPPSSSRVSGDDDVLLCVSSPSLRPV